MRCSICGSLLNKEIKFKDMMKFDFFCDSCKEKIYLKESIVPIDNGYLMIYKYFATDDNYISMLERKIFRPIYSLISSLKNTTLLFLDDNILPYLKYINFCQNIVLLSTIYVPLEIYIENDEL